MGVNLTDLVKCEVTRLRDLRGRALAIDAYNALYQFLSIIRQPDGTPLMDRRGRVTSHLSGLIYRTSSVLQEGILPVYVFDGTPHPLKRGVLEGRLRVRRRAEKEWRKAQEAGDLERAMSKAQQTSRLTDEMVANATDLLRLLGVPTVQAPRDGEAQASHMAARGDVWATGSQDYDSLLYGSPRLVKNLGLSGRRKLPGRQTYVTVNIELIELEESLRALDLTREQLVDLAILVGTDFNEGVKGIGPKKALGLVRDHGTLERVAEAEDLLLEGYEDVRTIFLQPEVTEAYELRWEDPDEDGILDLLVGEHDFSRDRVASALRRVQQGVASRDQSQLDRWL